jgi:hypothetical protein
MLAIFEPSVKENEWYKRTYVAWVQVHKTKILFKIKMRRRVPVVHAYNLSYLGVWNQEDQGSRLVLADQNGLEVWLKW